MSTLSIGHAVSDLIQAPLEAVLDAETKYLQLWKKRLETIKDLYVEAGTLKNGADLATLVEQSAPVVQLEGKIDMGLTMRIAGVSEKSGGLGAGLAVGPVHASGSFGFVSRSTHESIFQAASSFIVANKQFSLKDYLKTAKINLATPQDLTAAIEHLGDDLKSRKAAAALETGAKPEES